MSTLEDLFPEQFPDRVKELAPTLSAFKEMETLLTDPPREITVADVLAQLPLAYVSGRAGTGKTTLAQKIDQARGDAVMCATTGIAAVNLGNATTLNSLLHYFDTVGLQKHHQSGYLLHRLDKLRRSGLRIIILDEVSMLPADQLTALVEALDELSMTVGYDRDIYHYGEEDDMRLKLLLVGDFAQLPPVEAPYAFESPQWHHFAEHTLKLEKVWRQENQQFADALHAIRLGKGGDAVPVLKDRFVRGVDINFDGTTIVAKNLDVDLINNRRHAALPGEPIPWATIRSGEQQKDWVRQIPEAVGLKPGALVMTLMNRPVPRLSDEMISDYYYVNGDLGTVVEPDDKNGIKVLIHRTQKVVTVVPVTKEWTEPVSPPTPVDKAYIAKPGEVITAVFDDDGKAQRVISKILKGHVSYMPLRLAYATTVHKSQGLSLDRVQVAIGDWMFSKPGMLYVALSRCRSLEGLHIVGNEKMLLGRCGIDPKVRRFL
jgi:hypothetical protein